MLLILYSDCRYAECCNAESSYSECRNAECRYTECGGALPSTYSSLTVIKVSSYFRRKRIDFYLTKKLGSFDLRQML
jgi:hypothetical protein